jgi:ribonuclease PH
VSSGNTPTLSSSNLTIFPGSISTADGSALVRLGDTTIVCGVKAEIAEPDLDRPGEGFLGMHTTKLGWDRIMIHTLNM